MHTKLKGTLPLLFLCLALPFLPASSLIFATPDYYLGDNETNCAGCHGNVINSWKVTAHASAHDSIAFLGFSCLPCHNTGWNTDVVDYGADEYILAGEENAYTVTDSTNFFRVKNIQCENCHGPLGKEDRTFLGFSEHREAAVISLTAESCGSCHQGSHHPTYTDWEMSLHAKAKATTIPGGAFDFIASDPNCSACHTAEGFLQFVNLDELEPNVEAPGPEGNDLTCAACHNPHDNTNPAQLRMPVEEICVKCHNPEYNPDEVEEPDGSDVHHSTAYMFEGKGGYEYEGFDYASSAHTFVVTEKCVTCHVFMTPFVGEPEEIPAYTGHTFEPQGGACVDCHTDFNVEAESFDYRGIQTKIDSLALVLEEMLTMASPEDSLTAAFLRARFNLQFVNADGSHGIHNTKYAEGLLVSAIQNYIETDITSSDGATLPITYSLEQNYPNPFNPSTIITFNLPKSERIRLTVYNLAGVLVRRLVDSQLTAGQHDYSWNGYNEYGQLVSAGAYIYRLESESAAITKKMILLK